MAGVAVREAVDVSGSRRDIPSPASESAMLIERLNSFGEEHTLGPVAVDILASGLQHQHVSLSKVDYYERVNCVAGTDSAACLLPVEHVKQRESTTLSVCRRTRKRQKDDVSWFLTNGQPGLEVAE